VPKSKVVDALADYLAAFETKYKKLVQKIEDGKELTDDVKKDLDVAAGALLKK
jgi:F0F1-type ATP synthase alpha subunit